MCSAFAVCVCLCACVRVCVCVYVCVCVCRSKKQDRGRDRVKDRHRICTLIPFYKVMLGEILPGSLTFLYIFETEAQTFFLDYYFKGVSIENSWLLALPLELRAELFFAFCFVFIIFVAVVLVAVIVTTVQYNKNMFPFGKNQACFLPTVKGLVSLTPRFFSCILTTYMDGA